MSKDLTNSAIHRQNILNNTYALQEIEKATRITGIPFEGKTVVLKEQVAAFFEEACERMLLRTRRQLETMWEVRTGANGAPIYRCASPNISQVGVRVCN